MRVSSMAVKPSSALYLLFALALFTLAPQAYGSVSIAVSPQTVLVPVGGQQQFSATVTGTANTKVTWTIVGSGCSGSACGTITANGLYTAPPTIPSPPVVLVTATSQQDPSKSSTANATIIAHIQISVRPAKAEVLVGGHQQFTAVVTGTANTVIHWSATGAGCKGASCGTISSSGLYTAPAVAPNPPLVTITAQSAADPSKSASAAVTVTGPVSISITPRSAPVVVGSTQQFSAIIGGTTDTRAIWNVIGTGCTGADCGTVSANGLYFAPPAVPNPAQVFVTVTSVLDPTKSATAVVTILAPFSVTITPPSATVVTGKTQQFSASVNGSPNQSVLWSVVGCAGIACGTISSSGLYTAPSKVPAQPVVKIKAAAAADQNVYRLANVTVVPPISVSVTPPAASLVVDATAQFKATITGSTDQSVTWSVSGAGCSGTNCGIISSTGFYTAPDNVPTPPFVKVTATSTLNPAASNSATVRILPPVGVQVSPAGIEVVTGQMRQFTATVTGTTNSTVNWSVSGSGCTGIKCGTITSTGLYTAPVIPPNPPQVFVKATSVADPTKSSFATVTVIAPVDLTISPASVVVSTSGKVNFRANVIGATDDLVTWSLSGVGCSGSACGTLDSSGVYTAPSKIPTLGVVIVTATSQVDPSVSQSAIVTIVASNDAKLTGSFTFQFSGLNAAGVYDSTGVFKADGKGNIVSGVETTTSPIGSTDGMPLTGTYSIGSDNRGVLVLNNGSRQETFRFALNQAATKARGIQFDGSGILASGELVQQDPSALNLAALKGAFAVSLAGQDAQNARIGALTMLYLDQWGDIVGGVMDVNDNGTLLPTFISLTGTLTLDASGHGSLQLKVPGFFGGTLNYALYVASSDQFFITSTDPSGSTNPILAGEARRQAAILYSQASLTGNTVFDLSGGSSSSPEVTVGRMFFDGVTQASADYDENVAGALKTGIVLKGAYSVGVNGVGLLNLDAGDSSTKNFIAYVYGPDSAFLMDPSTSAVDMGELIPQEARNPFTTRDLMGNYVSATGTPVGWSSTLFSGTVEFDGKGFELGDVDLNQAGSLMPGQGLNGTYWITSLSRGRTAVNLSSPMNEHLVFWIASPNQAFGLPENGSTTQPVILHLDQ